MNKLLNLYIDSYRGLSKEAWLLAVVMLINRIGSMVIPFLGMYMSTELNFSKPQIGIVLGCFGLGSVCGSWLGGWLTDKFGNYKVQCFSLLLTVPIFFVLPHFKTVESLAGMIFLLTLVADTFRPANSVSVARYAKPENLTRAYSLNRMAINLGFSIGPALAGVLAMISYNWIFYGNALAALLAAIVFVLFFHNKKPRTLTQPLTASKEKYPSSKDRNAYLDPPFIIFNIFCCLFSMAFFQLLSTLPLYYKEEMLLPESQIGLLMGFSGFCIVVFEMLLVHAVEHRFTPRVIMILGTAIAGISYLMLYMPLGIIWLYLSMFILSIGEMLTLPFTATISASRATLNTQGAYMGFNSLAFAAANIFSPFFGTYLAEHYGYSVLWLCTGGLLIITSIGFSWILKKL
ncbi:MFS transporter [Sphingobacterium shayense]|uniref:MFS transporter n=1 Tax=Sphingobacterium shayense TaxID=626343 RepID=UPI001556858F|nr:MFS transporter [Sphingobacterium shayense]